MKIGIDVGGVVSKYPEVFWELINALTQGNSRVEVHIVSDMPKQKTIAMLGNNGFDCFPAERVHEADYKKYGEHCKAQVCFEQDIDVLIDDHMAYLMNSSLPLRLFVMPNPHRSYYAAGWKDDKGAAARGDEPPPESKNPPGTKAQKSPDEVWEGQVKARLVTPEVMFHRLWTKAVGTADYVKDEWLWLDKVLVFSADKYPGPRPPARGEAFARTTAEVGKFFTRQPETPAVNQTVELKRNIFHPATGAVLILHGSRGTVCAVWEDGNRFQVVFGGVHYHCRLEDLEVIG